jgi:hypothetical protein
LLSLVQRVVRRAGSEREVIAMVTRLVNSGRVELIGSFKGERFEQEKGRIQNPEFRIQNRRPSILDSGF